MNISELLIDVVFPQWCCSCNSYGELVCPKCFSLLEFNSEAKSDQNVDSFYALTSLSTVSRSMIHALKYDSVIDVAKVCARMMYLYGKIPKIDCITSVPLHPIRQAERGFNQAAEIGSELASLLGIPYYEILQRDIHTQNLASINEPQLRKAIIKKQFSALANSLTHIRGARTAIVDDVWTTGATIAECAWVLKQHGAHETHGITFTHGV